MNNEAMNEEKLKLKSMKELKLILNDRRVDYTAAVEKNDLIQLILENQPVIKPLSEYKPPSSPPQPEHNWTPDATKTGYTIPLEDDVLRQFISMGLGDNENQNITDCQNFLKRSPENAAQWYNLGVHLAAEGRMEPSKECYLNSVKFEPGFKLPHNNLGAYYKDHGDLDRAVYHYKQALESDPQFSIALNNLAVTYHVMGLLAEAQAHCRKAIEIEPTKAEAHNNLGTLVLHAGCSAVEAVKCFEKCMELDPIQSAGRFGAYSNRLLASTSMPAFCEDNMTGDEEDVYNAKIWRFHKEWAVPFERRYSDVRYRHWDNELSPYRKIKVAYVSTDLRGHPVSYFAESALKNYDRTQVEIFVYLNGPPGDKRSAEIKTEIPDDHWKLLGNRTPLQCAELIRSDGIDILVELGGHAAGNRQDITVLKAAPIQATWIGYANTTGLTAVDYRISDSIADPYHTQQGFSEQLVRMPHPCAFICYSGTLDSQVCAGSRALEKGYMTFGSFNALHKLTDQVFELWCRVLNAVPKSRIFLKNKPMASDVIRNGYIKRFNDRGISADRLILKAHCPTRTDHMNAYLDIDIALDPFPYAGTTTSAEALWMGCPLITLNRVKFPIHAQNVGASMLSRIPGLKQFIAKSKQEYVDHAVYWSKHLQELSEIKASLRKTMLKSPLCDMPLHQEKLMEVYREMWLTYCEEHSDFTR